jgi:hypothetical protein
MRKDGFEVGTGIHCLIREHKKNMNLTIHSKNFVKRTDFKTIQLNQIEAKRFWKWNVTHQFLI